MSLWSQSSSQHKKKSWSHFQQMIKGVWRLNCSPSLLSHHSRGGKSHANHPIKVPKFQVVHVNMIYTFRLCKYFKQHNFGNSYTHKIYLYFWRKIWLEYLGTLLKQSKKMHQSLWDYKMKLYFFTELSLNKTKFSKIMLLYLEFTQANTFSVLNWVF